MNSKACRNLTLFFLALAAFGLSGAQDGSANSSLGQNSGGAPHDNAYIIIVDLPQAIVRDLTVTDTLPKGLIYESSSLEVLGTKESPLETVSSPNDGSQPVTLTWSLGQVDNTADQDISLRFQPFVADVASNEDGESLAANQVSLQFTDDSGKVYTASGETASVKLVEPALEMAMSSSPDGGKTVTYSLSIGHTSKSHADAYSSDLSILLPAGTIYSPGSAEIVSAPPGGDSVMDDTNPQELKMHFDEIDCSWNKDHMILLKFQATTTAESKTDPGEIKATLGWKSASEDNPGTRSYITSHSIPVPARIPGYSIDINQVAAPDPVEAGQTLLLTINYANTGQDDVHGVTIEENYDPNVAYLSATPVPDADKDNVWTIGDLLAGGSGTIRVEVKANPESSDGTLLRNSVKISSEEQATDDAMTETMVKSKSDTTAKKASINSTNSTQVNIRIGTQIPSNNTENISILIPIENETNLDLAAAPNDPKNVTSFENLTLDAKPDNDSSSLDFGLNDNKININTNINTNINKPENSTSQDLTTDENAQDTGSTVEPLPKSDTNADDPNADQFEAVAEEPTTEAPSQVVPSQFDADPANSEVDQTGTGENPLVMESNSKDVDQKDPDTISDISTLSFSDGTKVDVVFAESSLGSDTAYAISHEEGSGLSEIGSLTNGSDIIASLVNATYISESFTNQTNLKVNQTDPLKKIPEIGVIDSNLAHNSTDLSNTGAVTTDIAAIPPELANS